MNRRSAWLSALALAGCSAEEQYDDAVAPPEPIAPAGDVHALFVGVDDYRFSRDQYPSSALSDLQGAVGDVTRFKTALTEIYGLDLDRAVESECESGNDISVTLTNSCATRERILGALDVQIDALEAGDTLLFYFAGHGSRYLDDEDWDQASGYNGTILPHDARNPDGSPGDIFDIELRQRKDRATAKGLYFVSIFDSCNSGTATRDGAMGQSRSVPVLDGPSPVVEQQEVGPADASGYWVHFAAAQDGEDAQETASGAVGERAGVFTTALIETLRMPGMAKASFGDIINEVQLRVAQNGATSQTPSAEGRLTASLGATSRDVMLFDAAWDGQTVALDAGSTSGITEGSTFAFYPLQGDAVAGEPPLATGHVVSVDSGSAEIALDSDPSVPLPERLVAEETAHFFPAETVAIGNALPEGAARNAVERALVGMEFVKVSREGAIAQFLGSPDGAIELRAADGTLFTNRLGEPDDPQFSERLKREMQKLARVQQLLSLRTGAGRGASEVDVCIAPEPYRPTSCPEFQRGGVRHLGMGDRIMPTLINRSDRPLYLYLLSIDPQNTVELAIGKDEPAITPGQPFRPPYPFGFNLAGTYRFVTIATETPIRAEAFEQSGSGSRDIEACRSPLARLLCSATDSTRDTSVTRIDDWSASVTIAIINDPAS